MKSEEEQRVKGQIQKQKNKKKNKPKRSLWREFSFMLHKIQNIIFPFVPLKKIIKNWNNIKNMLKEPPRKRELQSDWHYT